jgi:hypothetical protein
MMTVIDGISTKMELARDDLRTVGENDEHCGRGSRSCLVVADTTNIAHLFVLILVPIFVFR